MALQVEEYAYELIAALQPLVVRIKRQDKSLADQLTRTASSAARQRARALRDPRVRRSRRLRAPARAQPPHHWSHFSWCPRPLILASGFVFAAVRCSRTHVRSAPVLAKASPETRLSGRAAEK